MTKLGEGYSAVGFHKFERSPHPTTIRFGDHVTIHSDGRVELGPTATVDAAAREFWQAVVRLAPDFFNQQDK